MHGAGVSRSPCPGPGDAVIVWIRDPTEARSPFDRTELPNPQLRPDPVVIYAHIYIYICICIQDVFISYVLVPYSGLLPACVAPPWQSLDPKPQDPTHSATVRGPSRNSGSGPAGGETSQRHHAARAQVSEASKKFHTQRVQCGSIGSLRPVNTIL